MRGVIANPKPGIDRPHGIGERPATWHDQAYAIAANRGKGGIAHPERGASQFGDGVDHAITPSRAREQ
jgi:hypothetical protein